MAVISKTHRFLFIHSPRTGGTAVGEGVLLPHLAGEYLPPEHLVDATGRQVLNRRHGTLRRLYEIGLLTPQERTGLFVFATVRNPFDLEVSRYVNLRRAWELNGHDADWVRTTWMAPASSEAACMSFPEWVDHRYGWATDPGLRRATWRGPIARIGLRPVRRAPALRLSPLLGEYLQGADFVMRFERLQQDLNEVLRQVGVPGRYEIPPIHVTPGRDPDHRAYYDARSRPQVEAAFRDTIERFGYSF